MLAMMVMTALFRTTIVCYYLFINNLYTNIKLNIQITL